MSKIKDLIWYEKYRPKKIFQMTLSSEHHAIFKRFIKTGEIPHLLFYGPAGSGKTTLAHILMNKCGSRKLILEGRQGINVIQTRVKRFARLKTKNKPNIIFFDEANGLTNDAQEDLKNIIEDNHENCRFIFATNHIDKIKEPILSRCNIFAFNKLPLEEMINRIFSILDEEGIGYNKKSEKAIEETVKRFYPDFRTIINNIQLACANNDSFDPNSSSLSMNIDLEQIDKLMKKGKIFKIREILTGMSDFLLIYRFLFNEWIIENINDKNKSDAALAVADYMYKNSYVIDKEINLTACLIELMSIYSVSIDWTKK